MSAPSNIAEVFRMAFESRLLDVHTSCAGRIHVYDALTQLATVELAVKRPIQNSVGETVFESLPMLPDVPVAFPSAGGSSITWPLVKGDAVMVAFMQWDHATWRATGLPSAPGVLRQHGLISAYAVPSVAYGRDLPLASAVQNALVLLGPEVRLGATLAVEVDEVALATAVRDELQILLDAITNATPVAGDGGAAFKAAILSALSIATWPNAVAADGVTAKKP